MWQVLGARWLRIARHPGHDPVGVWNGVPEQVAQAGRSVIVVVDRRRKRLFTGVFAARRICMEVPLLLPLGLLLYIPPIRRIVGSRNPGCNGEACEL